MLHHIAKLARPFHSVRYLGNWYGRKTSAGLVWVYVERLWKAIGLVWVYVRR